MAQIVLRIWLGYLIPSEVRNRNARDAESCSDIAGHRRYIGDNQIRPLRLSEAHFLVAHCIPSRNELPEAFERSSLIHDHSGFALDYPGFEIACGDIHTRRQHMRSGLRARQNPPIGTYPLYLSNYLGHSHDMAVTVPANVKKNGSHSVPAEPVFGRMEASPLRTGDLARDRILLDGSSATAP